MLQGLRTVVYPAADLAQAKAWYLVLLNTAPYFDEPFYNPHFALPPQDR